VWIGYNRTKRIIVCAVIVGACLMIIGAYLFSITEESEGFLGTVKTTRPHAGLGTAFIFIGVLIVGLTFEVFFISVVFKAAKYLELQTAASVEHGGTQVSESRKDVYGGRHLFSRHCGHELSLDSVFCRHCGERLIIESNSTDGNASKICPSCGAANVASMKQCGNCGSRLHEE